MEQSSLRHMIGAAPQRVAGGRLPLALAGGAIVISLSGVLVRLAYAVATGDMADILSHVTLNPFLTIAYALVGSLVAARRPRNIIGWLFLTVALTFALNIAAAAAGDVAAIMAGEARAGRPAFVRWLDNWFWLPAVFLPTVFLFLLFPHGRLPSRRWRPFLWSASFGLVLMILVLALHPGPLESWGTSANPYGIAALAPLLDTALIAGSALLFIGFVGSLGAVILRYRRSRDLERKQMQWLLYALVLLVLAHVVATFIWFAIPSSDIIMELSIAITSLTVLGIAVAAAVAILRYRLYDIDLVVNRTVVYTTLTVCVVAIYVLIVGGFGSLVQARGNPIIGLLATGLVAVLFQPLRERVQRAVNHLFYGRRDEPLDALARLGRRLETAIAPDVVLPTLVETIAHTLNLPYVAIRLRTADGARAVAEHGKRVSGVVRLPLTYQGQAMGDLIAGPRAPSDPFSAADHRLLQQIAMQAGPAVHAVQLTAALQASRRELVTAREEERRRLRRDLHDGLGAALAGLHLQAGAVRRLIEDDPQAAEAMIDEFRGDIRSAIEEIRRLVYALRPPLLDQLGLAAAVRAQAAQCNSSDANGENDAEDGSSLRVKVEGPEELPPLPAAVEVAAYRIVQEALTNVVHHARAHRCLVRLQMNDALQVEIVDDGVGLHQRPGEGEGLGLLSMRERAAELGGAVEIGAAPGGGTRVFARLPLAHGVSPAQTLG